MTQEPLVKTLVDVKETLADVQNKLDIPSLFKRTVAKIEAICDDEKGQLSDGDKGAIGDVIRAIISNVTDAWNPPLTQEVRSELDAVRTKLNDELARIETDKVAIAEFYERDNHCLDIYIAAVYPKAENKYRFFRAVKDAYDMVMHRDVRFCMDGIESVSKYINGDVKYTFDVFKEKMQRMFLFYLKAAHAVAYPDMSGIEQLAVQMLEFVEAAPAEYCFNVLDHFYAIYVKAMPRKQREMPWIANRLFDGYRSAGEASDIAELVHFTGYRAKNEKGENQQAFAKVTGELKGCFRNPEGAKNIDFARVVEILRPEVPQEKRDIERATKIPDELRGRPVIVRHPDNQQVDNDRDAHYTYADEWVGGSLTENEYTFEPNAFMNAQYAPTEDVYMNEFDLPEEDKGRTQRYIHVPIIGQVMRYISYPERLPELKFKDIGALATGDYVKSDDAMSIPNSPLVCNETLIELTLDDMLLEDNRVEGTVVMLYLYDIVATAVISEPVYFKVYKGQFTRANSTSNSCIFRVRGKGTHVWLVIRLFHDMAIAMGKFRDVVGKKGTGVKSVFAPVGFAMTAVPLLDGKGHLLEIPRVSLESFHVIEEDREMGGNSSLSKVARVAAFNAKPVLEVRLLDRLPAETSYSWSKVQRQNLIAETISYDSKSVTPLIVLSGVKFLFKEAQKGMMVCFGAFLVDNDKSAESPAGLPVILCDSSDQPTNKYMSSVLPSTPTVIFPDIVRFIVDRPLSSNAHIILHFYTIPQGGTPSLYKVSVLWLFSNDEPIRTRNEFEIELLGLRDLGKSDYLAKLKKKKKASRKSKTFVSVAVPPAFVPHGQFIGMMTGAKGEMSKTKDWKKISIEKRLEVLLPACARLLTVSPTFHVYVLVSFLASFEQDVISKEIKEWTFRCFSPKEGFISYFCHGYATALKGVFKMPAENAERVRLLCGYLKTAEYCLGFITMGLMAVSSERNLTEDEDAKVILFAEQVTILIATMISIEWSTNAHQALVTFLFHLQTMMSNESIMHVLCHYLSAVRLRARSVFDLTPLFPVPIEGVKQSKKDIPPDPGMPKPQEASETPSERCIQFILYFARIFASSPYLLVSIAYCDTSESKSIIPALLDSANESMCNGRIPMAKEWTTILCELIRANERLVTVAPRCANAFIPYLRLVLNAEKNTMRSVLESDYAVMRTFYLPVLYILHTADRDSLMKFFNELDDQDQLEMIKCLKHMVLRALSAGTGVDPMKDLDTVNTRKHEDEAAEIESLKKKTKGVDLVLLNEVSVRVIKFLVAFFDSVRLEEKPDLMLCVVELIVSLLNRHQNPENIMNVMLIVSKLVESEYAFFFFTVAKPYSIIIRMALKMIDRRMRIARASGVALIVHLLHFEYSRSDSIVLSAAEILDQFIDVLFEIPVYKLSLYKMFLDRLKLFTSSFTRTVFIDKCKERLTAAEVIHEACASLRGENKSPELEAEMYHVIANQFMGYPLLRLKFLQRIVDLNLGCHFLAQAYEAEVQIASLINRMVKIIGKEPICNIDFSFVEQTAAEAHVDISHCHQNAQKLLIGEDVFNVANLIAAVRKASSYATGDQIFWQHRECIKILIEILEGTRDYSALIETTTMLGNTYASVERCTVSPLHFYLVESKRGGIYAWRRVYASRMNDISDYVTFLNLKEHQRFRVGQLARACSDIDEGLSVDSGIIVSRVTAVHPITTCSQTRQFVQNIVKTDSPTGIALKRVSVTTTVPHPNASIVAPVETILAEEYTEANVILLHVSEANRELKLARKRLIALFPCQKLMERWTSCVPILPSRPSFDLLSKHVGTGHLLDEIATGLKLEDTSVSSQVRRKATRLFDNIEKIFGSLKICQMVDPMHFNSREFDTLLRKCQQFVSDHFERTINLRALVLQDEDPLSFRREYEDY